MRIQNAEATLENWKFLKKLNIQMRPPCPWRDAEVAELRPEASGRWDGEDVGFVIPGHCLGCEQEEAAAHPGRPHLDTFSSKQDKTAS